MPAQKERRRFLLTNRQTLAGLGRVRKTIWLGPGDFNVPKALGAAGASPGTNSGCGTGSLVAACVVFPINGSAFGGDSATCANIPALNMGAGASPASRLWAVATFPKPIDADTSGSIIVYVDWTYGDAPIQSGCKKSFDVAIGYLNGFATTPTTVRTAASTGGASIASYVGTACGLVQSTCLGKLPSFTASDSAAMFVARLGASNANVDGTLNTGSIFILGYRLKYMANTLGEYSDE